MWPFSRRPEVSDGPVSTAGPIIVAEGVAKTYDTGALRVPALVDVRLSIARGEMVAVMGPSGSGKTTLLNCLSGLDDVDGGRVLIEGRELHAMADDARTRYRALRMGFIFQSYNLLPVLSAAENVELPLLVAGVEPEAARARALEALAVVGLSDRADHKPAELSGGQQQRVTIARSLVNDPAIVWADEPTGNLDTRTGLEILSIMKRLNAERGQTYVIVTHDESIARACDRILRMENGRVVREEPVAREGR
ncbi:MAG TPA: ABC transporter ATP-binding protein [Candidatus Thermoplasmatota archaeon]|nr:ABC transporter ATP-binding protein [Candidatus Thermoplasmatota archaeon]